MHDVLSRFLVSLAFDLGRYVLVAAPVFWLFWRIFGTRLRARWLRPTPPARAEIVDDVVASLRTVLVFAAMGVVVWRGTVAGIFRIESGLETIGLGAFWSTAALVVLQDFYFYVTHRAMHHRSLFRLVHLRHHRSRHTSPFTAYAFSVPEALVHAAFVPLVTLVLPVHEVSLFAFLVYMIVRNVIGHLGIELTPARFAASRFGRLFTTTTHHALHHHHPGTNFGLYFTFWDELFGTTDPRYDARLREATSGKAAAQG